MQIIKYKLQIAIYKKTYILYQAHIFWLRISYMITQ